MDEGNPEKIDTAALAECLYSVAQHWNLENKKSLKNALVSN